MNLVPPRRIERHPPVLQTGAQTTDAREALSARSAGSSTLAGIPLLPKLRPLLDSTKERQLVLSPSRLHGFLMCTGLAKLCRNNEGVTGFESGFHDDFSLFVQDVAFRENLPYKNTKPGFLAEIRALAFVAARRRWLTPCLAPARIFAHPVSVHCRSVDSH